MSILRKPYIKPLDILFSNKDNLVNMCKTLPTQITQNVPFSRQHRTETDGLETSGTVAMGDTVGARGDWEQSQVVCSEPVSSTLYWETSTLQSYRMYTDYGSWYCENTVSLRPDSDTYRSPAPPELQPYYNPALHNHHHYRTGHNSHHSDHSHNAFYFGSSPLDRIGYDSVSALSPEIQGAVSIRKTVLPGMAIPMLKIRRIRR